MQNRMIAGVILSSNKRSVIALTAIYGIGRSTANKICQQAGIDESRKLHDLSDAEFGRLQTLVGTYRTEGDLKDFERSQIAELVAINCFRGLRHAEHMVR